MRQEKDPSSGEGRYNYRMPVPLIFALTRALQQVCEHPTLGTTCAASLLDTAAVQQAIAVLRLTPEEASLGASNLTGADLPHHGMQLALDASLLGLLGSAVAQASPAARTLLVQEGLVPAIVHAMLRWRHLDTFHATALRVSAAGLLDPAADEGATAALASLPSRLASDGIGTLAQKVLLEASHSGESVDADAVIGAMLHLLRMGAPRVGAAPVATACRVVSALFSQIAPSSGVRVSLDASARSLTPSQTSTQHSGQGVVALVATHALMGRRCLLPCLLNLERTGSLVTMLACAECVHTLIQASTPARHSSALSSSPAPLLRRVLRVVAGALYHTVAMRRGVIVKRPASPRRARRRRHRSSSHHGSAAGRTLSSLSGGLPPATPSASGTGLAASLGMAPPPISTAPPPLHGTAVADTTARNLSGGSTPQSMRGGAAGQFSPMRQHSSGSSTWAPAETDSLASGGTPRRQTSNLALKRRQASRRHIRGAIATSASAETLEQPAAAATQQAPERQVTPPTLPGRAETKTDMSVSSDSDDQGDSGSTGSPHPGDERCASPEGVRVVEAVAGPLLDRVSTPTEQAPPSPPGQGEDTLDTGTGRSKGARVQALHLPQASHAPSSTGTRDRSGAGSSDSGSTPRLPGSPTWFLMTPAPNTARTPGGGRKVFDLEGASSVSSSPHSPRSPVTEHESKVGAAPQHGLPTVAEPVKPKQQGRAVMISHTSARGSLGTASASKAAAPPSSAAGGKDVTPAQLRGTSLRPGMAHEDGPICRASTARLNAVLRMLAHSPPGGQAPGKLQANLSFLVARNMTCEARLALLVFCLGSADTLFGAHAAPVHLLQGVLTQPSLLAALLLALFAAPPALVARYAHARSKSLSQRAAEAVVLAPLRSAAQHTAAGMTPEQAEALASAVVSHDESADALPPGLDLLLPTGPQVEMDTHEGGGSKWEEEVDPAKALSVLDPSAFESAEQALGSSDVTTCRLSLLAIRALVSLAQNTGDMHPETEHLKESLHSLGRELCGGEGLWRAVAGTSATQLGVSPCQMSRCLVSLHAVLPLTPHAVHKHLTSVRAELTPFEKEAAGWGMPDWADSEAALLTPPALACVPVDAPVPLPTRDAGAQAGDTITAKPTASHRAGDSTTNLQALEQGLSATHAGQGAMSADSTLSTLDLGALVTAVGRTVFASKDWLHSMKHSGLGHSTLPPPAVLRAFGSADALDSARSLSSGMLHSSKLHLHPGSVASSLGGVATATLPAANSTGGASQGSLALAEEAVLGPTTVTGHPTQPHSEVRGFRPFMMVGQVLVESSVEQLQRVLAEGGDGAPHAVPPDVLQRMSSDMQAHSRAKLRASASHAGPRTLAAQAAARAAVKAASGGRGGLAGAQATAPPTTRFHPKDIGKEFRHRIAQFLPADQAPVPQDEPRGASPSERASSPGNAPDSESRSESALAALALNLPGSKPRRAINMATSDPVLAPKAVSLPGRSGRRARPAQQTDSASSLAPAAAAVHAESKSGRYETAMEQAIHSSVPHMALRTRGPTARTTHEGIAQSRGRDLLAWAPKAPITQRWKAAGMGGVTQRTSTTEARLMAGQGAPHARSSASVSLEHATKTLGLSASARLPRRRESAFKDKRRDDGTGGSFAPLASTLRTSGGRVAGYAPAVGGGVVTHMFTSESERRGRKTMLTSRDYAGHFRNQGRGGGLKMDGVVAAETQGFVAEAVARGLQASSSRHLASQASLGSNVSALASSRTAAEIQDDLQAVNEQFAAVASSTRQPQLQGSDSTAGLSFAEIQAQRKHALGHQVSMLHGQGGDTGNGIVDRVRKVRSAHVLMASGRRSVQSTATEPDSAPEPAATAPPPAHVPALPLHELQAASPAARSARSLKSVFGKQPAKWGGGASPAKRHSAR